MAFARTAWRTTTALLLLSHVANAFSPGAVNHAGSLSTAAAAAAATTPYSSRLVLLPASVTEETVETVEPDTLDPPFPTLEESMPEDLLQQVELEAERAVQEMMDTNCEVDLDSGDAVDEVCVDEELKTGFRASLKSVISKTMRVVRGESSEDEDEDDEDAEKSSASTPSFWSRTLQVVRGATEQAKVEADDENVSEGEILERGWEKRANSSALVRNAEVWKFALASVLKVLKPRKMRKKDASESEIEAAQTAAAEFIRNGLLELGPSFVKLGQVLSTRTDVLPATYTDVLKTLTDDVPGFDGQKAKDIVTQELGRNCDDVFSNFSADPVKAASLGQVHTATYQGKKVAIKVQRSGLKELFDVDLNNLKKLAVLLDKFDPKSDGADRDWVGIYEESAKQLYREIDYLNEADNCERFAKDFVDYDYVRVPNIYREVTTPRVLVMEYVDSFKLTDTARIDELGLDRQRLARHVADWFLRQIVETSFFHADPHSGNLCVDETGDLVVYDFGQMDELGPNVRKGLRTFCKALFAGGPMISDAQLAKNAKKLVKGVEQAGVLSRNADRLAVEKLARFFMRSFKDKQLGKSSGNIKSTVGADLQTLTDNNSFQFPATFTFVFRAFVSVDGIGKELDKDFDIGKLAQPFIERFTEEDKPYKTETEKNLNIFQKATGLNPNDIETAVMQPRKVQYIEETIRAMEEGTLKIRVRSLENEKALERLNLRQTVLQNVLAASVLLNMASLASRSIFRTAGIAGAGFFLLQTMFANIKIKSFDKKQLQYLDAKFVEEEDETEEE